MIEHPSVVSRVGVVAKTQLNAATSHLIAIAEWLEDRGVEAVFETATAALVTGGGSRRAVDKASLANEVDVVLVLGGDGTLLSMADCIGEAGSEIPILGVNFGSLGFLTEVTLPELYTSLDTVLAGKARIEERLMLESVTERAGSVVARHMALNDVVVAKAARSRMIDLSITVGDEFVTRVKADGLIVGTPTGSTAYNLAAGGPIVQPSVDAIVITPIAPHTLTNRPIVIPASSVVRVQPNLADGDDVYATFDGQTGLGLRSGDRLDVRRSAKSLKLIRPSTRSYFEVLRTKLKWGER